MYTFNAQKLADSLVNELAAYDFGTRKFYESLDRLCLACVLLGGGDPKSLKVQITQPADTIRDRIRAEPGGPIITDRFTPMKILQVTYARPGLGGAMFTLDYFDNNIGRRDLLKRLVFRANEYYHLSLARSK